MRVMFVLAAALLVSACAGSGSGDRSYRVSSSQDDIKIYCPMDWSECYQKAREYCGPAGYREVRRADQSRLTTAGSGDSRAEEIYRRARGSTPSQREMTIRCKEAKE